MGIRAFDNVRITGLTASGAVDGSGTWNTAVDISPFVTIPAGATAVILRIYNASASAQWAGVRTPGKTTAELHIDFPGYDVRDIVVPFVPGQTTLDLYCENATNIEFRVVGVTDSRWHFFDIDGPRPTVLSTGATWASRTISEAADGAVAAIIQNARWRPVGATGEIVNPPTGTALVQLDGSKAVELNTGQAVPLIGYVDGGVTFPAHLSAQITATLDGTWRLSDQASAGSAIAHIAVDKASAGTHVDFRKVGSAYTSVATGSAYDEYFYTALDASGQFEYLGESGTTATMYVTAYVEDFQVASGATISWTLEAPAGTPYTAATTVEVRDLAGATVIAPTAVTPNASGVCSVSDAGLTAATDYQVLQYLSDYSRGRVLKLTAA